jgi:hypothetical protein
MWTCWAEAVKQGGLAGEAGQIVQAGRLGSGEDQGAP